MPPPAKRRKTAAGSVPVDTRRTTRSQRPGLSVEMIAKVATFAKYGDDLMNICLAVRPKDADVIRYSCLRNNMNYLQCTLEKLTAVLEPPDSLWDTTKSNIDAWMAINTDWRKLCTKQWTDLR